MIIYFLVKAYILVYKIYLLLNDCFGDGFLVLEEIRLHGRGGQGVVLCGELIALAALYDGKFSRAFPWFGIARRGAPVVAFVVIGEKDEITRSMVYNPKYVMVLDPTLHKVLPTVTQGIREGGVYLQNTAKNPRELLGELNINIKLSVVATVDATKIAIDILGKPIPNTVMLGAFCKVTKLVTLDSALKAIEHRFPPGDVDKNKECARLGYEQVKVEVL